MADYLSGYGIGSDVTARCHACLEPANRRSGGLYYCERCLPTVDEIKPGQLWRHKKGGWYVIDAVAERVEEEGGGAVVVYRNTETDRVWCQTVERFLEPGRFEFQGWCPVKAVSV